MTTSKISGKVTRKKRKGGANFIFLYERYRALNLTGFAQNSHIGGGLGWRSG
jgi:hypothetical protein